MFSCADNSISWHFPRAGRQRNLKIHAALAGKRAYLSISIRKGLLRGVR
jgi:hypothetical protein